MMNPETKPDDINTGAEPLVTVAVYDTPYVAGLAKSELEFYDIPVFLADEYTIGVNSLYANALGGNTGTPYPLMVDAVKAGG